MADFTLGGFAAHLTGAVAAMERAEHHAMDRSARTVKRTAKAAIGTYQGGVGRYAPWEQLHAATLHGGRSPRTGYRFKGKVELGFASEGNDNPLLRTGALRESIQHSTGHREAVVGSNSVYAAPLELGDPGNNTPPRSFLGASAMRHGHDTAEMVGRSVVAALLGRTLPTGPASK